MQEEQTCFDIFETNFHDRERKTKISKAWKFK